MRKSLATLVLLAACHHAAPAPATRTPAPAPAPTPAPAPATTASTPDEIPAEVTAKIERVIVYMGVLADEADAAKGSCSDLVTRLNAADNREANEVSTVDGDPAIAKYSDQIKAKYDLTMEPIVKRLFGAVQACASTPGLPEALDRLGFAAKKKDEPAPKSP